MPFGVGHTGEYALLVAVLLSLGYLLSPVIGHRLNAHRTRILSFGGGLAVAYVFLQLIPEVEEAHEYLGDFMHFVILFSFLGFYALETAFLRHDRRIEESGHQDNAGGLSFWLHIGLTWFYTAMVIFALPADVSESLYVAVIVGLAIALHVTYKSYVMHEHHQRAYEAYGQFVLVLSPLAGWLAHVVIQPSEAVFDIVIAVLAGFLMQNVFREELPAHDLTRFRWMLSGSIVLLVLVLLAP